MTALTQELARFAGETDVPGDVRAGAARAISAVAAAAVNGVAAPAMTVIA